MNLGSYLGVGAAVLLFFFIALTSTHHGIVQNNPSSSATSTVVTIPVASVDSAISDANSAASALETPSDTKSALPSKSTLPRGDLEVAATNLRSALVNIICLAPKGAGVRSISGSGVIIDPKGIILTNAHVAQYFLLDDKDVSCRIRAGSPAQDAYKAKLVFISPVWIHENAGILKEVQPLGTGERDFALLAITESLTNTPLPASFPSVSLGYYPPTINEPIFIGSYAAQFLDSKQIATSLYPTIVLGTIRDLFTFAKTSADVVSLGGSIAAQEGSSGGGIVNSLGTLIGTITTSTIEGDVAFRNVNAITASYIRREYANETGRTLLSLLQQAPATAVANFAPSIPALEALLTANLNR